MKYKGTISISRFHGSQNGISIEIQDELSMIRLIRVEIQPEAFGNAVVGLSNQNCTFELRGVDKVGMKQQHKTEIVPFEGFAMTEKQKKDAVAPFEVDGWRARLDDLGNHHRYVSGKGYSVSFYRHVPN